ncbi:PREDICTED: solute carrier organic anion transporter family member 2B1 [Dipodomys ordii]|uniref:Solute carrier organic anion transporter family member n=1 Tax=Dipodomys ordii TaxID=10020 RepID=A0A1S3EZT6_DIPOR|nr:PREDICTED: solute carrier organic anion transporter family member 2B1 [Dipodomys ordii]
MGIVEFNEFSLPVYMDLGTRLPLLLTLDGVHKPGPASEGPQMPDKDTKATMVTEDTSVGKACPEPQDVQSRAFHSIKFFVLCHSLLQLAQLMISGYLKSSISTVEKRFGLSSQTSGLLAAFNEVGNTALIVFVSYFGSRVHRPRMIGCGAVLVALAGLLMSLPHFISDPYRYDHSSPEDMFQDSKTSFCLPTTSAPASASSNGSCSSYTEARHLTVVGIMFAAQTLLGVGGVPIQPFGISYIDDFAHHSNSPLYLGLLFAVTMMGPGMAYGLGSLMLRLYVDIDRMPEGGVSLTSKDPRWVGAWWLGFLISASLVALAAIPYFFFPKEMSKEKHELRFRKKTLTDPASPVSKGEDCPSEQSPEEPTKKQDGLAQLAPDLTVIQFIKGRKAGPTLPAISPASTQPGQRLFPDCSASCSCPPDDFNPVCDTVAHVEYTTPCHAGCTGHVVQGTLDKSQVFYTNCSCVVGGGPVPAGSCDSDCSHLVLPFILLVSLGAAVASVTHTPSFMLILRGVKKEDKPLAVGMQFMLLRVLAWMPSPVIHGSAIDTTCMYWAQTCGRQAVCRYYDHDSFRSRFIGLQFFFKMGSLVCFALVLAILRQQNKDTRTKTIVSSPGPEQQLLASGMEKKPEDSRV